MTADWHYMSDDSRIGPISAKQLKQLADDGQLSRGQLVWKEGMQEWIPASRVKGLFLPLSAPILPQMPPETIGSPQQQKAINYLARLVDAGKNSSFVVDLQRLDFKKEVLPLNEHTLALLKSDFVFWSVALLAIIPLFLVTLQDTASQLTGFCIFFAIIWGVVFKKFVVEDQGGWGVPIASFLFTGLIGLNLLLQLFKWLPNSYMSLPDSPLLSVSLAGFVLNVGLLEELCKIIPVVGYLLWRKERAQPQTILLVGIFSGLGFAAFENVAYADLQITRSFHLIKQSGIQGLKEGVHGAMVNALLRSMSAVFGHAVYSGIFAHFIAVGWLTKQRRLALATVGLISAAVLHGLYDWSWRLQTTLPAIITGFGFMLFYTHLTNLRLLLASIESSPIPEDSVHDGNASTATHKLAL